MKHDKKYRRDRNLLSIVTADTLSRITAWYVIPNAELPYITTHVYAQVFKKPPNYKQILIGYLTSNYECLEDYVKAHNINTDLREDPITLYNHNGVPISYFEKINSIISFTETPI